jgi:hypothetical protein
MQAVDVHPEPVAAAVLIAAVQQLADIPTAAHEGLGMQKPSADVDRFVIEQDADFRRERSGLAVVGVGLKKIPGGDGLRPSLLIQMTVDLDGGRGPLRLEGALLKRGATQERGEEKGKDQGHSLTL